MYISPLPSMKSMLPPCGAVRSATSSGTSKTSSGPRLHADDLVAVGEPVLAPDVGGDLLRRVDAVVGARPPLRPAVGRAVVAGGADVDRGADRQRGDRDPQQRAEHEPEARAVGRVDFGAVGRRVARLLGSAVRVGGDDRGGGVVRGGVGLRRAVPQAALLLAALLLELARSLALGLGRAAGTARGRRRRDQITSADSMQ